MKVVHDTGYYGSNAEMSKEDYNSFTTGIEAIIEEAILQSKDDIKIENGEISIETSWRLIENKRKELISLIEDTFEISIEGYIEYGEKEL